VIFLFVGAFFLGQAEIERELTRLKSQETLSVGLGAGALSRNLDGIYRDLHFLEGHSALHDAVDVPTPQHIKHLAEDFLNFSHGKGIYDQVRWIDEAGMEMVRIDLVNGRPVAVSADKLQNKGQRYFFTDTIKLKAGEIFVSPLDLNIEQDKIEVPHKPMIRAATPLVDSRGAKRGILILNYYGRVMLDSFAETTRDIADHVMVVNGDGYWLKSPKTDEEWGFMFKRTDLMLAAQSPRAWASIRAADSGQEILPDGLWTWVSVYPLLAGQKSSTGAPDAFAPSRGEVGTKQYVWKAIAHLSHDAVSAFQQAIWLKLAVAAAMFLGLLGVGSWKLASAWTAVALSEAEVRRLNIGLEQKVNERTQELRNSVAELDKEVAERKRDERLRALEYAVARLLTIEKDASSGLKAVMRTICEVMNWARSTYWRTDEAAGVMRFAEFWDSPGLDLGGYTERSRNVVFAPGVGLVGRAWQSGEPMWATDFTNDPRVVQHELGREIGVRGVFVFPVTSEGRTIGALAFFSREVREPDERLLALTRVIGSELGQFLQRKRAEAELLKSEEQFRALAENLPLGLVLVAADGKYEFINSTVTRLTGYQPDDIPTGRAWFAKAFPDEAYRRGVVAQWQEDLRRVGQGVLRQREYTVTCKDGGKKIILFWPVMMRDGRQSILYEDVTERKQIEAQRAQLEVQLRESQKMEAIGTLAGGIAHDFNNILATILGNVELTRQDVSSNPRALESLEEIRKAGTRARSLVQQILSFGRRQPTERMPTMLAPIVEESARLLRATLPARLALEVYCDTDVPAVLADTTQIQQILINLATNSMQAMRSGPGSIAIRLDAVMLDADLADTHPALHAMHQKHPGRTLRLAVSDDGSGMDAITLGRAFEPFFTTKPVNEGTGLGLSVVYGIVQGHEGAILVDSAPGKGTTFTIYLPATDAGAPAPELDESAATTAPTRSLKGGQHILYIDDDESLVFLVQRLLERRGFRISGYTNQSEALSALRVDPAGFDLVVSDYNMPGMSGLDVARQVRAIRADLPVAVASGFIDEELRAQADGAGVVKLIFKADAAEDFCEAFALLAQKVGDKSKSRSNS
jgi:PAS domain S-box-containing protein